MLWGSWGPSNSQPRTGHTRGKGPGKNTADENKTHTHKPRKGVRGRRSHESTPLRTLTGTHESRVNPLFSHFPRTGQSEAGRPSQKSFKDSVIPRDPKTRAAPAPPSWPTPRATPPSLQIAPLNNTPLGFSRLSPSILRHGAARDSRVTQHVQHTSPGRAPHVAPSPTYRRIIDGSEPKLPRARKAP